MGNTELGYGAKLGILGYCTLGMGMDASLGTVAALGTVPLGTVAAVEVSSELRGVAASAASISDCHD